MKNCKYCNQSKNLIDFHKHKTSKDGYRNKCKICVAKQRKSYNESDNGKRKRQEYAKKRRLSLFYRLHHTVRHNITNSLRRQRQNKNKQSIKSFLPYTIKELKQHLESLWEPWMNWSNYGKASVSNKTWQIDHIIPTSLLPYDSMSHPNFLKCWNLSNLRSLESIENINKRNKIGGII